MVNLKICLLISVDPDDHQIISEAVEEISKDIAIFISINPQNVSKLLVYKKIQPDFIVIDIGMNALGLSFLEEITLLNLKIPIVIYTDKEININDPNCIWISKRHKYTDLLTILTKVLRP